MTWHTDQTEGRVAGDERDKLLALREKLVLEAQELQKQPLRSKTQSALIGRQEDLLAIAKKIKAIDKKLGRTV